MNNIVHTIITTLLVPSALLVSAFAIAQSTHEDISASKPHVHGLAMLTLALEDDLLQLSFESPAANLLGFEYQAASAQEKLAVESAQTLLQTPDRVLSFSGTSCAIVKRSVDMGGVLAGRDKHNEHDKHDKHDKHSEVVANYSFKCDNLTKLTGVSVVLFEQFPGIQEIQAMWVTPSQQGSTRLMPNNTMIQLR